MNNNESLREAMEEKNRAIITLMERVTLTQYFTDRANKSIAKKDAAMLKEGK